jgi:hypothetical protein
MHFFRALWSDALKLGGFTVTNLKYKRLTYNDIVVQDERGKFFTYTENLCIDFGRKSYVLFLKKRVYFDKTGYFDPSGINWKGPMGEQRIADWLPYEYSFE